MQLRKSTRQATVNSKNAAREWLQKRLQKRMAKQQQPVSTQHVDSTSDDIAQGDNTQMTSTSANNLMVNNNTAKSISPANGKVYNGILVLSNETVLEKEHSINLDFSSGEASLGETPVKSYKQFRTKPLKKKLNRIRLTPKILRSFVETLNESDSEDENVSEISCDDSVSVNNTRLSSTDESEAD